MSLVLQISDPHFGTEVPEVVNALLELARAQNPNVVVVSGDITQRARKSQFAAARRFLDQLGPATQPRLVVPGNHDIPMFDLRKRLFSPYANYSHAFGEALEPSYESDQILVVCVNTTRWFRRKHGEVSAEQIARVARRLRRARPEQLRIVVTHQPLRVIRPRDNNNLLRGYAEAARAWCEAGADMLMGGHIHLPYVRRLSELWPELTREAWVVQAGTAVSKRVRDGIPNSVNLVRMQPDMRCAIERWDYAAALGQFRQVDCEYAELSRGAPGSTFTPASHPA